MRCQLLALTLCSLVSATTAGAGSYLLSDLPAHSPAIIVHPHGYTGAGGQLTIKVCTSGGPDILKASVKDAIRVWNALAPAIENCQGNCLLAEDPVIFGPISMRSAVLHEMGHCGLGLGHVNLTDTSFTISKDSTSISPGPDGVRGSRDDLPSPLPGTRILHYFRTMVNNPFALDATVIDSSNFSRRILDLPAGHTWPASGNRAVGALLGFSSTQSVMYSLIFPNQHYRNLIADDVNTVKYGMSGLDAQAGTADDYTVKLEFVDDCSAAAIEVEFVPLSRVGICIADIEPMQTNHYRIKNEPVFSPRILIQINSLEDWGDIFFDGFESGDLSAWSSATP